MVKATTTLTSTTLDTEKALVEFKREITFPDTFVIKTTTDYVDAGETLKDIKSRQKKLDELKKSATRPIDEAKKAILALFADPEQRLKSAEVHLKQALNAYNARIEEARLVEQARLRDLQRKEQERLLARAKKAEEQGNFDKAQDLQDRVEFMPVPIVVMDTEKVKGISTRTTWHAEVTDLGKLVQAVASGTWPLSLVEPNMKVLANLATSLRDQANIPGVRIFSEQGVVARPD